MTSGPDLRIVERIPRLRNTIEQMMNTTPRLKE